MNIAETTHWYDLLLPHTTTDDGIDIPGLTAPVYRTLGTTTCRVHNLNNQLVYATCNLSDHPTGMRTTAAHLGLDGDNPHREFDAHVEIITIANDNAGDHLDAALTEISTRAHTTDMPQPGTTYENLITPTTNTSPRHGLIIMPYLWEQGAPRIAKEAHEMGRTDGVGEVTLLAQLILITDTELELLHSDGLEALQQNIITRGIDLNDLHRTH
ncbi:hypothetical protein [Corynebacterium aquilae]|nr:hypothetical protein [Corynebacterium aquilae]